MRRSLFTPSTVPASAAPDRLLLFIQQAQLELVYARERDGRLPLHDSFRLALPARSGSSASPTHNRLGLGSRLCPTVYLDPESNQ
jgi:hypothetical protein